MVIMCHKITFVMSLLMILSSCQYISSKAIESNVHLKLCVQEQHQQQQKQQQRQQS
jgi:hypothetical protein